jgi:hypothetical protein
MSSYFGGSPVRSGGSSLVDVNQTSEASQNTTIKE